MRTRTILCTALFASTFTAAGAQTINLKITTWGGSDIAKVWSEFGPSNSVVKVQKSDELTVSFKSSNAYELVRNLRRHEGVKSVEALLPEYVAIGRKTNSYKELSSELTRYKADYLAYYKTVNGPKAVPSKYPATNYLEAHRHFLQERAFPLDTWDPTSIDAAIAQRDQMPEARIGGGFMSTEFVNTWQFIGPKNLSTPYRTYYGLPPLGGRCNVVVVDPSNSNTLYAGFGGGGLWKSTNGGTNWTNLSADWPKLQISSIAIDPVNPNNIYVGTGDWDGGLASGWGMRKSTDAGATWTTIGATQFSGFNIKDIIVDPETPSTITAVSSYGAGANHIHRSTNGGASWTQISTTARYWSGLTIGAKDASNVRPMYVISESPVACFRSLDRGASWTSVPLPTAGGGALDIVASKVNTNNVYILCSATRSIYKSVDRGATWTNVSAGFPNGNASLGANYNWSQAGYDFYIDCSSNGATDVLYVGLIDVAQSPDAGATWRSVGQAYTGSAMLHNDQHGFAVDPVNPNRFYCAGDGGIQRVDWTAGTGTFSFVRLSAELGQCTQFYNVAYHPTNPNIILGGTQDNAAPAALGNLNNWANPGAGDGAFQAINPANPNYQFTTWQFLGLEGTNSMWTGSFAPGIDLTGDSPAFIAPIYISPADPNMLYCGSNFLDRYNMLANTWEDDLGGISLSASSNIRSIAVAPSDKNRIYVGTGGGELQMSTNYGATWTAIQTGVTSLPARTIKDIIVHPTNPDIVYVTVSGTGSGHVWRCLNATGGAARTWQNRSGAGSTAVPDASANSITLDDVDPTNIWYIGTDVGVFMTTDAGATWTNATAPLGLPNVRVDDVQVVPGTQSLYAGTHGRGIWRIDIGSTVLNQLTAAPNPVYSANTSTGTIQLTQPAPAGGAIVTLLSGNTALATVPNTVTVPAGATSVGFQISTAWVGANTNVTITASMDGVSRPTTLTLLYLAGDLDKDGDVDLSDYLILVAAFDSMSGDSNWNAMADLDRSGQVDLGDYLILSQNFDLP